MYLIKQKNGFSCSGYMNFVPNDVDKETLIEANEEQIIKLKKHELQWKDGELVQYEKTPEDIAIQNISIEKRSQQIYEETVDMLIRKRYTLSQELAILRQRETKPAEYNEYNEYAEQCKIIAKNSRRV